MSLLSTSLHAHHVELGAKMAPFAGYDMPLQYSSVKEEVLAVRNEAGIFDVSHMGAFFIKGKEAVKFVDYILTNDFANSEMGKAVYSPLCREDGTVIDDLIAYKIEDEKVLIIVNAANIKKDWDWISSQTSNFDIELTDESDDYSLVALQGPKTVEIMKSVGLLTTENPSYYSVIEKDFHGHNIILARTGYTGEDGFEIMAGHEVIKEIWAKVLSAGAAPCGLASRDVLRLEVCYPLYGHELNDELTPLDSALKWTVRMNKEDFIGKAALENYSPKFRLVKLSLDKGIPREGYSILNDQDEVIGKITSGTMSVTTGKGIAIGLVEKDKFPENKSFKINVRKNNFEAIYHTKAFVTGGHK